MSTEQDISFPNAVPLPTEASDAPPCCRASACGGIAVLADGGVVGPSAAPQDRSTANWDQIIDLLGCCGRLLRQRLTEHLRGHGISEAQFALLTACRAAPAEGLSQGELAAALALSPAHISGLVEQLRQRDWLAGQRAAGDRRRQQWRLTASGLGVLTRLLASLEGFGGPCGWAVTTRELGELRDALAKLSRLLQVAGAQGASAGTSPAAPAKMSSGDPAAKERAA